MSTHRRRSIRLKHYDYTSEGMYFVTMCTRNRECLFGDLVDGEMQLNDQGKAIEMAWKELPIGFPSIALDEWIIMPNHVHGIIVFTSADVGAPPVGACNVSSVNSQTRAGTRPAPTLGHVIGAFKSIATHAYIRGVKDHGWPPFPGKLWQRNYYEPVIWNEHELLETRKYIQENPLKWDLDPENPLVAR